jgi:hypothetical protein
VVKWKRDFSEDRDTRGGRRESQDNAREPAELWVDSCGTLAFGNDACRHETRYTCRHGAYKYLQQARSLLASSAAPAAKRGRPKKSALAAPSVKPAKKKRNLSPEGRARIAEAVKKRWATQKAKQKTKA